MTILEHRADILKVSGIFVYLTLFEAGGEADLHLPSVFAMLFTDGEYLWCNTSWLLILWSPLSDKKGLSGFWSAVLFLWALKVEKLGISLSRFEKLLINQDFPEISNAHNIFVFEDMGMVFGILTSIYMVFDKN